MATFEAKQKGMDHSQKLENSVYSVSIRNKFRQLFPIITIVLGVLFLLSGLGLGIPYVSPNNLRLSLQPARDCNRYKNFLVF